MPALIPDTPTLASLIEGDKLVYKGTCSLQVSVVNPDGGLISLKSFPPGTFYEAPVTGDYSLSVVGGCCNNGEYAVFPRACCTGPDYENLTVCDANTGTLWVQWVKV